jgi:tetratricopeptide (TPR) repeat protein
VAAYTHLATVLYKQSKFADAVALLRRCPKQSDLDVREQLGMNLFKTTRPPSPEAVALLEGVIQSKPNAFGSHVQLGQYYLKTDQKRAAAHFEAYFKYKPATLTAQEDEIRLALANAYFYSNDYQKAIPLFERALPDADRKPNIYFNLATCYLRAARLPDAERLAQKYVAARPDDPRGAELLAAIHGGGK